MEYSGDPSIGYLVADASSSACDPLVLEFSFNSGDDPAWLDFCSAGTPKSIEMTVIENIS